MINIYTGSALINVTKTERDKATRLCIISQYKHEAFQMFCLCNVLCVRRFLLPVIVYITLLLLLNSHYIQLAFSQASTQPYLSEKFILEE
jgi:hypothetical protein